MQLWVYITKNFKHLFKIDVGRMKTPQPVSPDSLYICIILYYGIITGLKLFYTIEHTLWIIWFTYIPIFIKHGYYKDIVWFQEPTSGLDSSTAHVLMEELKDFASLYNKTLLVTIHQPSSQIFHMFSTLLLLVNGNVRHFVIFV